MAHNIETIAYAGETPWHGLGVRVPDTLTTDEMLVAAGLDWEVNRIPLSTTNPVTGEIDISPSSHLYRMTDGRLLDVVSDDWEPNQNKDAFDFFHEFVEAGEMKMHTAGSLQNGKIVWALAEVDDSFTLFNGDRVQSYLLFTNPHQYGRSIDIRFSPIRVVCNNTLTIALNEKIKDKVRFNHRSVFNPERAKELLGIAHFKLGGYKERAEFLGSRRYDTESLQSFFEETFPVVNSPKKEGATYNRKAKEVSKNAKLALEYVEVQPGADFAAGTWWSAFNAITYMTDHVLTRSQNTRLESAWYGRGRALKLEAMERALEYANRA